MADDSKFVFTARLLDKPISTLGKPPEPGTYGTGRPMSFQTKGKRPRGKPAAGAQIKRDRIAAYVLHLQRTKPGGKLTRDFVPAAATFFKCDEKTVWKAWREYLRGKPVDIGYVGPMHWISTSGTSGTY